MYVRFFVFGTPFVYTNLLIQDILSTDTSKEKERLGYDESILPKGF